MVVKKVHIADFDCYLLCYLVNEWILMFHIPALFFAIFARINWKYFVYDIICVIKSSGPNYEEIPAALHYAPLADDWILLFHIPALFLLV